MQKIHLAAAICFALSLVLLLPACNQSDQDSAKPSATQPATRPAVALPPETVQSMKRLAGQAELIVLGKVVKIYDGTAYDGGMSYDVQIEKVFKGILEKRPLHFRSAGWLGYAKYAKGEQVLLFLRKWENESPELVQLRPIVYISSSTQPGALNISAVKNYEELFATSYAATQPVTEGGIELILAASDRTVKVGQPVTFKATLSNKGKQTVKVMRSRDGSDVGWVMPKILVTIWGPDDRPIEQGIGRCGNVDPLKADDIHELQPGDQFNLFEPGSFGHYKLSRFSTALPGIYKVRMVYDTRGEARKGRFGDGGALPEGVAAVHLESNLIKIEVLPTNDESSDRLQVTSNPVEIETQPAPQLAGNANESRAHIWKKYPALKEKQDKALVAMKSYLKSLEPEAFAAKHQQIIRLSTSRDPVERTRAHNAIAALRDIAALPILVEAVEKKDRASSRQAVMLLAKWAYDAYHEGSKKVPKELAPLLPLFIKRLSEVEGDEQPNTRANCFQAIGCLADSEWLPLVKDLSASRHPAVTHWAVWAAEQLSKRDHPAPQE